MLLYDSNERERERERKRFEYIKDWDMAEFDRSDRSISYRSTALDTTKYATMLQNSKSKSNHPSRSSTLQSQRLLFGLAIFFVPDLLLQNRSDHISKRLGQSIIANRVMVILRIPILHRLIQRLGMVSCDSGRRTENWLNSPYRGPFVARRGAEWRTHPICWRSRR